MTTQPPVGPLDSESVKLEDVLFFKLKDLILEQSEGEWTDEMIVRDAHHFANHLRPLFRLPSEAGEGAAEQYNQARRDFNRMRDDGSLSDEPTTPPTDPRLDRLKLAICGGEDVPGAIAAVTVEDCERFLVEERQRHEWSDTQQARLDRAIEALEPFVRHGRACGAFDEDAGPFWIMTESGHRDVPAEDFNRARQALAYIRREA